MREDVIFRRVDGSGFVCLSEEKSYLCYKVLRFSLNLRITIFIYEEGFGLIRDSFFAM